MTVAADHKEITDVEELSLYVLSDNVHGIQKIVDKANKKANKYGAKPIDLEIGKAYLKEFTVPGYLATHNIREIITLQGGARTVGERNYMVCDIKIVYTPIKIKGGWRVLGSVEMLEGSEWNVINGNIDNIGDLKQYDLTWCDHCNKRRNRKKVIVLEDKDGNRKDVGRQCIKDYLGISITNAIFAADFASYIWNLFCDVSIPCVDDPEDERFGGSLPEPGTKIDYLARIVAGIMEKSRWTYRSNKNNDYSTGMEVMEAIANIRAGKRYDGYKDQPFSIDDVVTETSDKAAEEILAELKAEFPAEKIPELDNSFDYDLAVMLHVGDTHKESYFIGMMGYRMYKRYATNNEKKRGQSNYYGNVGDKIKGVEIEITKTMEIDGCYGNSLMICGYFAGTDDKFVTFNSGNTYWMYNDDNSVKESVVIAATIKRHEDRGYGKQTSLTRVRLSK